MNVMDEKVYELFKETRRPNEPRWNEMVAHLDTHETAVEQIRQAAALPGMGFKAGYGVAPENQELFNQHEPQTPADDTQHLDRPLIQVLLPQLGSMRLMGRLLLADGALALSQGDGDRAYRDLIAILGLARHTHEPPTVFNDLVSMSLYVGYDFPWLADILTQQPQLFSDEQLRNLAHRLAVLEGKPILRLDGERMGFHDLVQRMYTDDGHGDDDGRMTFEGIELLVGVNEDPLQMKHDEHLDVIMAKVVRGPITPGLMASRRELLAQYDLMMDQVEASLHESMRELPRNGTEEQIVGWSSMEQMRYYPITAQMPAFDGMRRTQEVFFGHLEGAMLGIALELYRRAHGAWPDTLEQLSPAYVPVLPVDRITGGPMQYRIVDDYPIVYSLGADRDDDGGRIAINHAGTPVNQLAAQWLTPQELSERDHEGDWLLWPLPAVQPPPPANNMRWGGIPRASKSKDQPERTKTED
jgi:hypothetical protein